MEQQIINSNLSWDEYFMRHVYLVASKSKDPSTKVGTVLVKNNIIISSGYNGFPRGVIDYEKRYLEKELKYSLVAHSEANSIFQCAKMGISSDKSICYTTWIPCQECCKSLIQGGIKEVVVHKQFGDIQMSLHYNKWVESAKISQIMFLESEVKLRIYSKILGIKTLLNGELVEV